MIYYPVIIPTLNRYQHLKRCVESLAKNTHADKTELVIGLDFPPSEKYYEGYEKIKSYIHTISGFAKVTIFERETNYGPGKNFTELKKYVFQNYDAVISSEDDNEFSPCFLDYMDKLLAKYKDDERYSSVGAYLHPCYENKSTQNLILTLETNAWGIGHWREKENLIISTGDFSKILLSSNTAWKCFKAFPASFGMLIEMVKKNLNWGDVRRTNTNIINDKYQIRPSVSLVRNWGNDGSGLHCGVDEKNIYIGQTICDNAEYDIGENDPHIEKTILRVTQNLLLPINPLKRLKFYLHVLLNYIGYRVGL